MKNTHCTIGIRELTLSSGEKVIVSLGMPVPIADDESEYCCTYQITGLQKGMNGRAIGSDALQALQLALVKIGTILHTSEEWKGELLTWNGDRELGFPLPDSIRDLRC